jgi:proteasome accessory factor B
MPPRARVRELPRSRPPLERMLRIHQELQAGKYPTANTLAEELEISSKSIHRDLEFMKYRLNLPIEFSRSKWGYHYTEEVTSFPTLHFTEGELVALVVAEKALQQYRGTSFEKPLLNAIRKMEEAMPDLVSLSITEVNQVVSFRTRAEPILNLEIFDTLARATSARQQLQFYYRKPGHAAESRIVDPYHLANINGEWFLFGYDHLRKDIRTFVPARIQNVRATGKSFKRQASFSLENRLRDSFGVFSGDGTHEVALRFDAVAADYIREKKWHESQKLKELPGGGVELRMKLSSLGEVERWVLSWGGRAQVISPPELADTVKTAARNILQSKT